MSKNPKNHMSQDQDLKDGVAVEMVDPSGNRCVVSFRHDPKRSQLELDAGRHPQSVQRRLDEGWSFPKADEPSSPVESPAPVEVEASGDDAGNGEPPPAVE